MTRQERIVRAMSTGGNLFLLITLPELRTQGMTYLAFYALQRAVEMADHRSVVAPDGFSEYRLRCETGLPTYETSRACSFLARSGLITTTKSARDHRVHILIPTDRGRRILDSILSEAGRRLWEGISSAGRIRRVKETTDLLRSANRRLLGTLQLSFFDKDLWADETTRKSARKRPPRPRRPVVNR